MALPQICVFNPITTLIDQITGADTGPATPGTPVVTNINGVIDSSFLNIGSSALAGEAINSGSLVNLYNSGGLLHAQNALAIGTGTAPSGAPYPVQAQGFAVSNAVTGQAVTVSFFGTFRYIDGNSEFGSSDIGVEVYLSAITPGGITKTPPVALTQAVGYVVGFASPNIVTVNFISGFQDFSHISGVNPITKGGTGATTGAQALINLIGGSPTSGQALIWNGTAWIPQSVATSFTDISSGTNTTATMTVGSGASLTFSGSGVVNANELYGNPLSNTAPTTGQALVWSGTAWTPSTVTILITATASQVISAGQLVGILPDGTAVPATATPPGAVTSVTIAAAGFNYAVGDTGAINASAGGTSATYLVTGTSSGAVTSVEVLNPGTGYVPDVTQSRNTISTTGTGFGLAFHITGTLEGGIVDYSVSPFGSGGSGYALNDTGIIGFSFGSSNGNATYQVTGVSSGQVTSFTITNPGSGYSLNSAPYDHSLVAGGAQPGVGSGAYAIISAISGPVPALGTAVAGAGISSPVQISQTSNYTAVVPQWAATTFFPPGTAIVDTNGNVQVSQLNSGSTYISSGSAPNWSSGYANVNDGGVRWKNFGAVLGTTVYLSTTPGSISVVPPLAPALAQKVGQVTAYNVGTFTATVAFDFQTPLFQSQVNSTPTSSQTILNIVDGGGGNDAVYFSGVAKSPSTAVMDKGNGAVGVNVNGGYMAKITIDVSLDGPVTDVTNNGDGTTTYTGTYSFLSPNPGTHVGFIGLFGFGNDGCFEVVSSSPTQIVVQNSSSTTSSGQTGQVAATFSPSLSNTLVFLTSTHGAGALLLNTGLAIYPFELTVFNNGNPVPIYDFQPGSIIVNRLFSNQYATLSYIIWNSTGWSLNLESLQSNTGGTPLAIRGTAAGNYALSPASPYNVTEINDFAAFDQFEGATGNPTVNLPAISSLSLGAKFYVIFQNNVTVATSTMTFVPAVGDTINTASWSKGSTVMLVTDGNHQWIAIPYANPNSSLAAGSDTDVQYNSSGVLAGSGNFTWTNGTGALAVTGTLTVNGTQALTTLYGPTSIILNGTQSLANTAVPTGAYPASIGIAQIWSMSNTDTEYFTLVENAVRAYDVTGSVSSGVFTPGETVTQAVSGATARLFDVNNSSVFGNNDMYIGGITGSPDATDIWTGGTSGATYTPTATPTAAAFTAYYMVMPTTPEVESQLYFFDFTTPANNGLFTILAVYPTPPLGVPFVVTDNAAGVDEAALGVAGAQIQPTLSGGITTVQYDGTQNSNANASITGGGIFATTTDNTTDSLSGLLGYQVYALVGGQASTNPGPSVSGNVHGIEALAGFYSYNGVLSGSLEPIWVTPRVWGPSTITAINGVHITGPDTSGTPGTATVTNVRGLLIDDQTAGGLTATNTYAIQVGGAIATTGTAGTLSALKQTTVTGLATAIRTVTSDTAATLQDYTIKGNGTLTVTLPVTGIMNGQIFRVKNIGTGVVTVTSTGLIDGSTDYYLSSIYDSADFQWDGTTWSVF